MSTEELELLLMELLEECINQISTAELKRSMKKGAVLFLDGTLGVPSTYQIKYTTNDKFKLPFVQIGGYKFISGTGEEFRRHLIFFADVLASELVNDMDFAVWVSRKYPPELFSQAANQVYAEDNMVCDWSD